MRPYLFALVLLSGCATGPQNPMTQVWLPPNQGFWDMSKYSGAPLAYSNGQQFVVSSIFMRNVIAAKSNLERTSGVKTDLALVDTEAPNAFAFHYNGRPVIALSISYLNHLGRDEAAIATTIGHELAHLHLGHSGAARQEREQTANVSSQVVGTVLNAIGIPLGGLIASVGVTAYSNSFTRDEERAADDQGLKWAIAAGYDPCGHARVARAFEKLGPVNVPFLSTHPGFSERSELANEYAMKTTGRGCS